MEHAAAATQDQIHQKIKNSQMKKIGKINYVLQKRYFTFLKTYNGSTFLIGVLDKAPAANDFDLMHFVLDRNGNI